MNRRIFLGFWLALFGVIAWSDRRSWTRKPMPTIDKGQKPEKFRINHDAFHAKYAGRTAQGIQCFMTSGFHQSGNPARGAGIRRDFVMLYLFDLDGNLAGHKIDEIPSGANKETAPEAFAAFDRIIAKNLKEIGPVTGDDILIKPFNLMHDNIEFGLIARERLDHGPRWWQIICEPGNTMAFHWPWDGNYDT
jgi:hypothetical protein